MFTKGDWNELSLHGRKMKPKIKLSFAFNLLSSRHNLRALEHLDICYSIC